MWDAELVGQNDAQGEAGQLLICGSVQRSQHNLLVGLLRVLVDLGEMSRYILQEAVIEMHKQAQEDA